MDFDALRARVAEGVQSSLDILEGFVGDLRMDADTLVDKVFDKIEEIVEQAEPAAPQEPKETSNATHANWKMREPYVAPETGGRTREELERIETMYKYIVDSGPTYSKISISAYPLSWWLNNPDQDATLRIHYRHALIYNKDNVEWN